MSNLRTPLLGIPGALEGSVGDHRPLDPQPRQLMLSGVDFSDAGALFIREPRAPAALGLLVDHGLVVSLKKSECKCEIPIASSLVFSESVHGARR